MKLSDGLPIGQVSLSIHNTPIIHPVHVRHMVHHRERSPLILATMTKGTDLYTVEQLWNDMRERLKATIKRMIAIKSGLGSY